MINYKSKNNCINKKQMNFYKINKNSNNNHKFMKIKSLKN